MSRAWLGLILLLSVSAAQAASCSVTATPVAFGSYVSPDGPLRDSTGSVSVTCTPDLILLLCSTSYTVALSTGGSGSFAPRRMSGGAGSLNYNLYSDSARSIVWGDGTGGSSTVSDAVSTSILALVCALGTKDTTVFGRIPANQNVGAGTYSDTIVVTVTF